MNNQNVKNRRWRPEPEIGKELAQAQGIESIQEAASLQPFLRTALFANAYEASPDWARIITLTPAGEEALQLSGISPSQRASRADILMATFSLFFHHELLVDCGKCDLKALRQLMSTELLSGRIRWPYRFGRVLYDKFNDSYLGNRTDHLLPEEALALVDRMPQGIYQVGRLVSGPLGLLEAPCARYFPPTRSPVLWHCSDPGCQAAHSATLLPVEVPVVWIRRDVRKALEAHLGPASEWPEALPRVLGRDVPREPYTYFDVCAIIGDCIVREERASLVTAALSGSNGNFLRDVLSKPPRKRTSGRGAPEALAKSLGEEEQLQLLFLLKDSELVRLIDQCVKHGSIRIPPAETRQAKTAPSVSQYTPTSELSSLGIRCSGNQALLDFCALVWEAYSSAGRTSELDWRLRNRLASGTQNMLLDYLCKNEPATTVKDLVLASEPVTKSICEKLKCDVDDPGETRFLDSLLWKLGFDLPRFSETLGVLRRRLESFSQELLKIGTLREEHDRERIRSVGVNLFVSIEEFLDAVVSFNVWLLASDHFLGSNFRYDAAAARRKVPEVLGSTVRSGEAEMAWNSENANTLGSLMAYLNAAASWMKALLGSNREPLVRPAADLPGFAEDKFRVFPFRHTALWADSEFGCLERLVSGFAAIVTKVARSNLAAIRNGLDHNRDEAGFPTVDQMLAFVAHFREAVDLADINRFFPKEFWLERAGMDRFDRMEYEFKDYQGRSHVRYGPWFVQGLPRATREAPVIIAPGSLLGYANAELLFRLRDTSVFAQYWEGYPRRRQIPNGHNGLRDVQSPTAEQMDAPKT